MLTYEGLGTTFICFINALLYTFSFAVLVFVLFILYMTLISVKVKDNNTTSEKRHKMYRKNYRSLLYCIPLLVVIFLSLFGVV